MFRVYCVLRGHVRAYGSATRRESVFVLMKGNSEHTPGGGCAMARAGWHGEDIHVRTPRRARSRSESTEVLFLEVNAMGSRGTNSPQQGGERPRTRHAKRTIASSPCSSSRSRSRLLLLSFLSSSPSLQSGANVRISYT